MSATSSEIVLPDGRVLDMLRGGAQRGPALVMHHGTPSDATVWLDWDDAARAAGLQLLAISRPGYATSTRRPGRSVASVADDVAALLASVDAPWFVTVGWSGGGPHALASAALLADRCRGVATLAGVGPSDASELDFLAGMGPENIEEFGAARAGESALRAWMTASGAAMRTVSAAELVAAFGGLLPPVDQAVLVGGFAERFAAELRRALAAGFDGWIDDDLAFTRAWGFDLSSITVPVRIWQGDLDLMVPIDHGRWLGAHIPTATVHEAPGHGHLSLVTGAHDLILRDLLTNAGGSIGATRG